MKGISSKWKELIIFTCVIMISGISLSDERVQAFSSQIIQRGAVGDDVIELQARLQNIGYYHGKIDGVYGWGTYWALRNFQKDFGLPIDGLAGATTKNKLTKASNFNKAFVHDQINKGNEFTYYGGVDIDKQIKPKKAPPQLPPIKRKKVQQIKQMKVQGAKHQQHLRVYQKDTHKMIFNLWPMLCMENHEENRIQGRLQ